MSEYCGHAYSGQICPVCSKKPQTIISSGSSELTGAGYEAWSKGRMEQEIKELRTRNAELEKVMDIRLRKEADDLQAINELRTRVAEYEEAHKVLDEDPSRIIRNAKDGYPEGRPDRTLTLAERVKAICKYASDYVRWLKESESKNEELQNRLSTLEKAYKSSDLIYEHMELHARMSTLLKASEGLEKALETIAKAKCENPEECCHWQLSILANSTLADFRAVKEKTNEKD